MKPHKSKKRVPVAWLRAQQLWFESVQTNAQMF